MKPKYWTLFWYGGHKSLCSEHTTINAAKRAAKKCEARGGAKHWILKVEKVKL